MSADRITIVWGADRLQAKDPHGDIDGFPVGVRLVGVSVLSEINKQLPAQTYDHIFVPGLVDLAFNKTGVSLFPVEWENNVSQYGNMRMVGNALEGKLYKLIQQDRVDFGNELVDELNSQRVQVGGLVLWNTRSIEPFSRTPYLRCHFIGDTYPDALDALKLFVNEDERNKVLPKIIGRKPGGGGKVVEFSNFSYDYSIKAMNPSANEVIWQTVRPYVEINLKPSLRFTR